MGSNRAIRALVELRRGGGEALHSQLEGALRAAIRSRRLAPGSRVPTTRQLAADLGVTRRVVVEAYEQLAAEGYLLPRRGAGTWVALDVACPEPAPAAMTAGAGPAPEIDLRPGGPDLALFPRTQWATALRSVILRRSHGDLGYDHPTGHPEARTTVASWLTRTRAAMVAADGLILVSGVAQALDLTARVLIPRGLDVLAVEDPGHPEQRWALRRLGFSVIPVPVDDEGVRVDVLAASGARAVLVTPAHQFPTGSVMSPARRRALLAWARDTAGVIVEDDYDAEYRYDRAPVGCLQGLDPDLVVYAGSASKILAPAIRMGWLIAPARLRSDASAEKIAADRGSPVLDQLAFAEMIESGALDRHLRRTRGQYRQRRDLLTGALRRNLPDVRIRGVAAGLHLLLDLPDGVDEDSVVAGAAKRGVGLAGMRQHHATSTSRCPALIVGYGRVRPAQIEDAVAVIGAAVGQAKRSEPPR